MRTVGCEYPVIPGEIDSGFGHQGGQSGDEVRRLEDHMSGAVSIGRVSAHTAPCPGRSVTGVSPIPPVW